MLNKAAKDYREAICDTDRDRALKVVRLAVGQGLSPEKVLFDIVIPSLDSMLKLADATDGASLAQYLMAAQIGAEVTEEMVARFSAPPQIVGCVVLGTAAGDFHGLGKRIVRGCVRAMMIEVVDLGLNVSAERFVEEALQHEAQVIGIAAMMVHTARGEDGCLKVRKILQEQNLEKKIRIIVGGAPYRYDHELYKIVKADAWAENGIVAGQIITGLIKGVKQF